MILLKTTVDLRDDLHAIIIRTFGNRGISKAINGILSKELLPKDGGFGKFKWMANPKHPYEDDKDDGDL